MCRKLQYPESLLTEIPLYFMLTLFFFVTPWLQKLFLVCLLRKYEIKGKLDVADSVSSALYTAALL